MMRVRDEPRLIIAVTITTIRSTDRKLRGAALRSVYDEYRNPPIGLSVGWESPGTLISRDGTFEKYEYQNNPSNTPGTPVSKVSVSPVAGCMNFMRRACRATRPMGEAIPP